MAILVFTPSTINVGASPGGLDENGGHYCRTNCEKYGLETDEYHYHNEDGSIRRVESGSSTSPSKTPGVTVFINGVEQNYSQPPIIDNGSTLVPLRGIFESLGATVNWNQKQKLVTATRGDTHISLKIGSKSPTVNGNVVPINVPGKIVNGATLVPLRFVSEALGADVKYEGATKTISITSDTE